MIFFILCARELKLSLSELGALLRPLGFYLCGLLIFTISGAKMAQSSLVLLILSLFLANHQLYSDDFRIGMLEKLSLSRVHLLTVVLAKLVAFWLNPILPMLVIYGFSHIILGMDWLVWQKTMVVSVLLVLYFAVIMNFTSYISLRAKEPNLLAMVLSLPFLIPLVVFAQLSLDSDRFWANFALLLGFGGIISIIMAVGTLVMGEY